MTNASYKTEMATMQTASRHVHDVEGQINASLNALMSKLETLYSTWQGAGATSFHSLKERWRDSTKRLNESLDGISVALAKTATQYSQAEDSSDTDFKGVAGSL